MENDGYEFADYLQALMRLLSSMLVRDYEQTNSLALHTECRAGRGAELRWGGLGAQLEGSFLIRCRVGSKEAVERLHDELAAAVKHLAGAPLREPLAPRDDQR